MTMSVQLASAPGGGCRPRPRRRARARVLATVTRIYTRKGDDGTTSLWYGGRVDKRDARTEAYGALDEPPAALGVARSLADDDALAADVLRLQNELFIAGSELATAPEAQGRLEPGVTRLAVDMIPWLEQAIDRYMAQVELPPK